MMKLCTEHELSRYQHLFAWNASFFRVVLVQISFFNVGHWEFHLAYVVIAKPAQEDAHPSIVGEDVV